VSARLVQAFLVLAAHKQLARHSLGRLRIAAFGSLLDVLLDLDLFALDAYLWPSQPPSPLRVSKSGSYVAARPAHLVSRALSSGPAA